MNIDCSYGKTASTAGVGPKHSKIMYQVCGQQFP